MAETVYTSKNYDLSCAAECIKNQKPYEHVLSGPSQKSREFIKNVALEYLRTIGKEKFYNLLCLCIEEVISNSVKANIKRAYFLSNNLDISNPSDYEKGMKNFKEAGMGKVKDPNLVKKVNNLNVNDDVYQIKNDIEELEGMYNDLNSQMDDCDNDLKDSSDSNTKPLINKLTQFRSDLDIAKNKLNSKKNSWQTNYNLEMLKEGKLSGFDKKKAERDIIIDQHKETDSQGDLIKGIGEHIKGSNQNMENINAELKQQGEQIINLQGTTTGISGKVSNTERVMTKIERRQVCGKVIGAIAIIVVGLADIAILVCVGDNIGAKEQQIIEKLKQHNIPLIKVYNQADKYKITQTDGIVVNSTDTSERDKILNELTTALIKLCPEDYISTRPLLGDLLPPNSTTVMIIPIDYEAPKGRLILPQVMAIRDCLDHEQNILIVKEDNYTISHLNPCTCNRRWRMVFWEELW